MKKVIITILSIIGVLSIVTLIGYLIFYNALNYKGKTYVECNYKTEYKEEGYSFKLLGYNIKDRVKVTNNININKMGKYKVTYSVKYLFFTIKKVRYVIVKDLEDPVITLKGSNNVIVCPNKEYEEEGYEAIDNLDGDITDSVEKTIIDNVIFYKVKDSSKNTFELYRIITKEDTTKPELTLKGSSSTIVNLNSSYTDEGYNVKDNCDEDVTVSMSGSVNTSVKGTYYITYTATDSSGNTSTVTRTVKVDKFEVGYVYLTFDDGPGSPTSSILDTLKAKGVKATFFVTGIGRDDLIKREYNEGHSIGLHTYTHVWSDVYSSVEGYFKDLQKVSDRVYRLTGTRPTIIRFPGGSSNTVSNRYSNGIMNTLVKEVVNRGYSYFDWNISSGDAGGCSDSDCIYKNVVTRLSRTRNNIVLMHDIKWNTANALGRIIDYCKANNYEFRVITNDTPPVRFK